MARAAKSVLVATETFCATVDGQQVMVWKGETRVAASHPVAKDYPHLFEPAEPAPNIKA